MDFEVFDNVKLDECFGYFYMDFRKVDGSYYKVNLFEGICYGLNWYLKSLLFNKKYDIIKDFVFIDSNICFKVVFVEIKCVGKGDV